MIDARRMEVFTAVFTQNLDELMNAQNCILTQESFKEFLDQGPVLFLGNGSNKFKELLSHKNAVYSDIESTAEQMALLSYQKFLAKDQADLAYSEPLYGKEFYSPAFHKA